MILIIAKARGTNNMSASLVMFIQINIYIKNPPFFKYFFVWEIKEGLKYVLYHTWMVLSSISTKFWIVSIPYQTCPIHGYYNGSRIHQHKPVDTLPTHDDIYRKYPF
jgi:hypothetical protein